MFIKTGVLIFLVLLLLLRTVIHYQNISQYIDGEKIDVEVSLLSEPKVSGRIQKFYIDHNSHRFFVTTSRFPELHYSDNIRISGTLKVKLLDDKNQLYLLNFPKIEAKNEDKNKLLAISGVVRQNIADFFQKNLSPNYSGLLLGIVFGIKEYIPVDFLDDLKVAGVMHVIAASGMNVTLVAGFLNTLFSIFFRRQTALFISILGVIFYAVLAGLSPSIIRASIMGIILFSASIFGRQMWSMYSLILTGFIMLFLDPSLLWDIGFQLSFLATLGLLFAGKGIESPLANSFKTTFFAQIATLPILLANFGTYSVWSMAVNTLVLWTVPIIMIIGGVSSIISFVFAPLAQIFLYCALPVLIFFESVVKFFAGLGGIIAIESISWQVVVGYYFLLASFIMVRSRFTKFNES